MIISIIIAEDLNSSVYTSAVFIFHDDMYDNVSHLLPADSYKLDYEMTRRSQDKLFNSQRKQF